VELLYKYGWRIGIISKFDLNENGQYYSESKGRIVKGKLTKVETKQILDNGVLKLKSGTVSSMIHRITDKLFRDDKISYNFSCHDLRQARITVEINDCNNIAELMKVSRKYQKDRACPKNCVNGHNEVEIPK